MHMMLTGKPGAFLRKPKLELDEDTDWIHRLAVWKIYKQTQKEINNAWKETRATKIVFCLFAAATLLLKAKKPNWRSQTILRAFALIQCAYCSLLIIMKPLKRLLDES